LIDVHKRVRELFRGQLDTQSDTERRAGKNNRNDEDDDDVDNSSIV